MTRKTCQKFQYKFILCILTFSSCFIYCVLASYFVYLDLCTLFCASSSMHLDLCISFYASGSMPFTLQSCISFYIFFTFHSIHRNVAFHYMHLILCISCYASQSTCFHSIHLFLFISFYFTHCKYC